MSDLPPTWRPPGPTLAYALSLRSQSQVSPRRPPRGQRALYWLLNLVPRCCRRFGYHCGWVPGLGFVPTAGCPIHDPLMRKA
jgi:hypothetical protein